ncbi:MAG: flagellar biosynthesis protein FlhB [Phycisphaerales bacterium]|nr:MAG: flagellar biosynthesis protein FlhB [Phycisphaerales bacterium]
MADDPGERTEQPTEYKLRKARERGQVGKSQDLAAVLIMAGAACLVLVLGLAGIGLLADMMRDVLDGTAPGRATDPAGLAGMLAWIGTRSAWILLPTMLAMFAVALLAQLVQVGWFISPQALAPKLDRLNPIAGFRRIMGPKGWAKFLMDLCKLVLVVAVVVAVVARWLPALAGLPLMDLRVGVVLGLRALGELAAWMLAVLLVIGLADLRYQKWQHRHDNRMTKQEVKEEQKAMDGDPEVRQRRMRIARQIAMQRIQQDVPGADVVVTNPTHYSVALRYDAQEMAAPIVVAKGADFLALRIREVARLHGVPIVERPPLARALYRQVEVGQPISPEHYEAVAEVLAYVYRLDQGRREAMEAGR